MIPLLSDTSWVFVHFCLLNCIMQENKTFSFTEEKQVTDASLVLFYAVNHQLVKTDKMFITNV